MNDGLDAWEDLWPLRKVFESIYNKAKCYLNCFVLSFTGAIRLQVVGRAIKQLYIKLFKKWSPKFAKKFRILVGYQLSG